MIRHSADRSHQCHAAGCRRLISTKYLMCLEHWKLVRPDIQKRIWDGYQQGNKTSVAAYHAAVIEAKRTVRELLQQQEAERSAS